MQITILTESELRTCVPLDHTAIEAVEVGFTAIAEGRATIPPIMRVDVHEHKGEVDIKSAYIQGLDSFAIKIASGYYENHKLGLPSGSGMMVLIEASTGRPQAMLLDNGYLTDVQYLAPNAIEVAGVIGSGMQARFQIRALKLVRDFSRLLVYGLSEPEVDQYVTEMQQELGVTVKRAESAEAVVRGCDALVTTTPSKTPVVMAEWVHPGMHITAMGSDSEVKQELESEILKRADKLVCDLKSQCFRLGELHHALEGGLISEDDEIIELGDLTSGRIQGRSEPDDITVCDLTGVGIQDTAIARLAFEKGIEAGLGRVIEL
jgi:ornithine cyclodeaminase